MTGKERVLAALAGAATDHLPLMPITMMFAADTAGIRYRDYVTDHTRLVEAQLRTAGSTASTTFRRFPTRHGRRLTLARS